MTIFFASSVIATNGISTIMFNLKSLMVSGGWTVVSSSNGTTFQAGDIITADTVLTISNAWFTIRQPLGATSSYGNVQRELGFQRTTNNSTWKINYSYSNGLTGGNATTLPSSSDMQWIVGDSSTGVNLSGLTDGTYRLYCYVDSTSPYPVWAAAQTGSSNSGNPFMGFFIEPMMTGSYTNGAAGTDTDPYVFFAGGTASQNPFWGDGEGGGSAGGMFTCDSGSGAGNSPRAYMGKGSKQEHWGGCGGLTFSANNAGGAVSVSTQRLGPNSINGNYDLLPIIWARVSTATLGTQARSGYKGIGAKILWKTTASMNTLDTVTVSQTNDHIVMRDCVLPWTGSATIIP